MPQSLSTDNSNGWYPQARRVGIPAANYSSGNNGRLAVVEHIAVGSVASVVGEFTNAANQVSAHFVVGKDGSVTQFVSVQDTSYANGLSFIAARGCWQDPERNLLVPPHTPAWPGLTPPTNPNFQTISIEHEGRPEDARTDATIAADAALLRWLAQQFPTLAPYVPGHTLIGHCDISPISRAGCPGPQFDFAHLAALANALPPPARYRVVHPMPVLQATNAASAVALGGTATVQPGDILEIDDPRADGFYHLADGRGFVLKAGLEGPI